MYQTIVKDINYFSGTVGDKPCTFDDGFYEVPGDLNQLCELDEATCNINI